MSARKKSPGEAGVKTPEEAAAHEAKMAKSWRIHNAKVAKLAQERYRKLSKADKARAECSEAARKKIESEVAASGTTGILKEFERDEVWEKAVTDWEPPLAAALFQGDPAVQRNCPVSGGTGDRVNHPRHYTSHPSGVETIVIAEHMSFCVGNAIKYLMRAEHKGSQLEDLEKSIWYIKRELERLSKVLR